jgi:hypothetical protein
MFTIGDMLYRTKAAEKERLIVLWDTRNLIEKLGQVAVLAFNRMFMYLLLTQYHSIISTLMR